MTQTLVWAHYLKDELITFRPPEEEDAGQSFRWHEAALPLSAAQVLEELKATETVAWGQASTIRLIAGYLQDGGIVGSVKIERHEQRVETLVITPSRALAVEMQRDIAQRMMRIVVPWLIGEIRVMSIVMHIPEDHDHLIQEASDLSFRRVGTLREHILRPAGYIDVHVYQLLNPSWTLPRETSTSDA